jgi:hypothetical protein
MKTSSSKYLLMLRFRAIFLVLKRFLSSKTGSRLSCPNIGIA